MKHKQAGNLNVGLLKHLRKIGKALKGRNILAKREALGNKSGSIRYKP